jgi:hypothetical protein
MMVDALQTTASAANSKCSTRVGRDLPCVHRRLNLQAKTALRSAAPKWFGPRLAAAFSFLSVSPSAALSRHRSADFDRRQSQHLTEWDR